MLKLLADGNTVQLDAPLWTSLGLWQGRTIRKGSYTVPWFGWTLISPYMAPQSAQAPVVIEPGTDCTVHTVHIWKRNYSSVRKCDTLSCQSESCEK